MPEAATVFRQIKRKIAAQYHINPEDIPNPLGVMVYLSLGVWPPEIVQYCVAGSKDDVKSKPVPVDIVMDACKALAQYGWPRLSSQEVSGPEGGAIQHAVVDMTALMAIPEMRRKIEELQIQLSDSQRALPPPADGTIIDVEEESHGAALDERPDRDVPGVDGGKY